VLEDSTKHISRLHITIEMRDGAYFVNVHSKVNPVLVDGRVMRAGQALHLRDGARITMSPYELVVRILFDADTPVSTGPAVGLDILDGGTGGFPGGGPGRPRAPVDDPFSGLDAFGPPTVAPSAPVIDPFQQAPAPAPMPLGSLSDLFPSASSPSDGFTGVDGNALSLDPLALLGGGQPVGGASFAGSSGRFGQSGSSSPGPSGLQGGLDHVHDVNLPFTPPAVFDAPAGAQPKVGHPFDDGFDPFAELLPGASTAPTAAQGFAQSSDVTELSAKIRQERGAGSQTSMVDTPLSARPMAEPMSRSPAASAPPAGDPAAPGAAAAFLRGMNLGYVTIPPGEEAVFLQQSGMLMQTVVETLIFLLLARTEVKGQLGAEDRTMLAARDNNPLKMMSDPGEALRYLFDPAQRNEGFLPPIQAVEDAAKELRAHELALVAGLRAAVLGTIKRFDPKMFEAAAAKSAGPLAINKRAKSWEAFVEAYTKLDRDAADSIDRIFKRDFLRAYMEQVRLLSQ
jgi:type VI secretion system FHA domain protein